MVQPAEKPAFQRVYTDSDADGVFRRGMDTAYSEFQTGCIAYHPAHDHLHFQDFANYALARLSDGAVVASSYKVTFCIMDSKRFFSALPSSPGSAFFTDCNGPMQGISVGWSDEYPYTLADQYLVLNPGGQYIGDGEYCLFSVADPGSRLREGVNAGNAAAESQQLGIGTGEAFERRRERHALLGHQLLRDRCPSPGTPRARAATRRPRPLPPASARRPPPRPASTWRGRRQPTTSGVTGYRIYRDGAMVGTVGPATAYPDTTARAGTTYDYHVRAVDAAGNESGPSETRSVRTPVTVRFGAAADARVEQANPASNHGTSTTLRTDGGSDPDVETYLRFNVTGVTGPIASAKLRLRTASDTADGPAVYGTDWTGLETAITWNNRPARTSGATDDKARIGSSTWVEYDVTSLVAGDGAHSFVLATGSSDGIDFRSREYSDATRRPELVLTY